MVRAGGEIFVTAPARFSENAVETFFKERARRIARAVSYFSRLPKPIALPAATYSERGFLEKKLADAVERAARSLNIPTPQFKVRIMRSRFGSCSARGALSFSDSLRALPDELFEYIVAHETAHCREHNHSSAFWALVEQLIPDWRTRRQSLKKYNFVINTRE
ncbi:MAG: peptidase [Parcubacteria group bacterium Gr01-1014_17]|nr:MAG: peptidase [Parcubacteria group bacterium Gr01-1014_17]